MEKTVAIARFWMGYKIYLASLGPILMAASVVSYHLNAIKYCPQQRTHLHDVKLHSFHSYP